jgi:hypothetical protein
MHDLTERRIRYWTIALALAGPLAFFLVRVLLNIVSSPILIYFDLFVYGAILLFVVVTWAGVAFFDLMAVVIAVYERAWRRLMSGAILLVVILATAVNFGVAWHVGKTAGDYARLFILYPSLLADIDRLPADRPRFMAWGWDATMTHELGLAYDESDEIASSQPSEAWKQRAKEVGVVGSGYRPLYGHFYLVDLQ